MRYVITNKSAKQFIDLFGLGAVCEMSDLLKCIPSEIIIDCLFKAGQFEEFIDNKEEIIEEVVDNKKKKLNK